MSAEDIVKSLELRALFLKHFSDPETRALSDFLCASAEFKANEDLALRRAKANEIVGRFSSAIKALGPDLVPSEADVEGAKKGIFDAAAKAVSTDLENAQLAVFRESPAYQDWASTGGGGVGPPKNSLKSKISNFEQFSSQSSSPSIRRPGSLKAPRKAASKPSDEGKISSEASSLQKDARSSSSKPTKLLSANAEVTSSQPIQPINASEPPSPDPIPMASVPVVPSELEASKPIAETSETTPLKPAPSKSPKEVPQIPMSPASSEAQPTTSPPPRANTVARPPPPSIPQLAPISPLVGTESPGPLSPLLSPLSPTPPNVLKVLVDEDRVCGLRDRVSLRGIALVSNRELSEFDGMQKLFIELDSSSLAFYSDQFKSDLESVIQFNLSSWTVATQSSDFFSNLIQLRSDAKDVLNLALPSSQPASIWFNELRRRCDQAATRAPRLLTRSFSMSKLSGVNGFIPIFGVSQFRGRDRYLRDSATSHMSNEGGLLILLSGSDVPSINASAQFNKTLPKLLFENEFLDSNASRAFSEAIATSVSRMGSLQGIHGLAVAIRSEEILSWRLGSGCSAFLCCDAARAVVPLFDSAPLSTVMVTNLDGRKVEFVVVASNGLWKVLQPIEAVKIARDAILAGLSSARAAEEVVKVAYKRKAKESLSVQLVQIGPLATLTPSFSKQVVYLQEALKERTFFIAFREFIYSHFTEENLVFYLNAVFFETLPEEALLGFAQEIHRKFFAPNAPHLLNLDAAKRKELASQYIRVHRYMFRPTMNRIFHVLRTEWYPQFLLSPGYIEYSQGTTTIAASKRSKSNELDILSVFKGIKKPLELMPPSTLTLPWVQFVGGALADLRGELTPTSLKADPSSLAVSKRKGLAASTDTASYEDDFDSGFADTKKSKNLKGTPSKTPKSAKKVRVEDPSTSPRSTNDAAIFSAAASVKYVAEVSSEDDAEDSVSAEPLAPLKTFSRVQGIKSTKMGSKKMSFTSALSPQTFGSLDNLLGSIRQLSVMLAGPIPHSEQERTERPQATDSLSEPRPTSPSNLSRSSPNLTDFAKSSISVRASVMALKPFSFLCVGWSGVGCTAFVNRLVAFKHDTTKKYIGEIEEVTPTFMFPIDDNTYPCLIRTPRIYATQSFSKTFTELSQSAPIDGIILCYDVTDRDSYTDFVLWAESGPLSKIPAILLGTHLDEAEASREVPLSKAKLWAKKRSVEAFEVSSVTGENIMESFAYLLKAVFNASNSKDSKS